MVINNNHVILNTPSSAADMVWYDCYKEVNDCQCQEKPVIQLVDYVGYRGRSVYQPCSYVSEGSVIHHTSYYIISIGCNLFALATQTRATNYNPDCVIDAKFHKQEKAGNENQ